MNTRFLMSAAFVLAACDPSSGEGESSPLDALPQGTDLDPDGGKADGQPQFAFASAQTVSNLAYPEPDEPGEQTWSDDELVEIFRDRVTPASPAESPWNLARKAGPLGYYGPLGPYGPLGSFGPVGNNIWNPSTIISGECLGTTLHLHLRTKVARSAGKARSGTGGL